MDDADRKKIIQHRCDILSRISVDMGGIIDKLYSKGVITEAIKDKIEDTTSDEDKARLFLDKLVKCGPAAYTSFMDVLKERGLKDLVELMDQPTTDCKSEQTSRNANACSTCSSGATGWTREREKTYIVKEVGASEIKAEGIETIQDAFIFFASKLDEMQNNQNKQMAQMKEDMDKYHQEMEKKLELNRVNYSKSLEEINEKMGELSKIKEENDRLKNQQQKVRDRVNETQEKLNIMNTEKIKVNKENKTLKEENVKLTETVSKLEKDKTSLEIKNVTLEQKTKELEVEKQVLSERQRELESDIEKKDKEILSLETGIREKISQLEKGFENATNSEQKEFLQIKTSLAEIKTQVDINTREIEQNNKRRNEPNKRTPRPYNNKTSKSNTYNVQFGYNNNSKPNTK